MLPGVPLQECAARPSAIASPATVAAFHREIRHTLRLEHPSVLPTYDVGEAAGLPFYSMRHVKDGSLRQRLERDHPLSLAETVGVIGQTAAALAYAHAHRILHCDVKPENILLDGNHVYLADFGISRAVRAGVFLWASRASASSPGGTASYVSPEQALGESGLDGRTDLYSLACVTYEMLAGRPPFTGENDQHILARRFASAVPVLDGLRERVSSTIRVELERALSSAPDRRQPSVTAFAAALHTGAARSAGRPVAGLAAQRLLAGLRRVLAFVSASLEPTEGSLTGSAHGS